MNKKTTTIIRTLAAIAVAAACSPAASARVYYVTPGGTGDGTSWQQATGSIQAAIDAATAGDQVWIAQGTYRPDSLINSTRPDCATSHAFFLKDGVSLYGGFWPGDSSIAVRDQHGIGATILNADDDVPDVWVRQIADGTSYRYSWQYANDSLEVVGTHGNSTHLLFGTTTFVHPTRIDGLTLQGANANIWRVKASGAALYAMGNVQVSNCLFRENSSYFAAQSMTDSNTYGGAVFLYCDNGEASITGCTFERNYAHSAYGSGLGGAIYGRKVNIRDCVFVDCVADDGGAVYNNVGVVEHCDFYNCYASGGGSLFNNGRADQINVYHSRGLLGGGVYNYAGTLSNVHAHNCYADAPEYGPTMGGRGGGIYLQSGDVVNAVVCNNTAFQGGGIFVVDGRVVNGTIQRNQIRASLDADTANIGFHNPDLRDDLAATHVFNSIYLEADGSNFVTPTTWRGVAATAADSSLAEGSWWELRAGSEFIDAGEVVPGFEWVATDAYQGTRIANGRIDLGAAEYHGQTGDVNADGRFDIDDVNIVVNIILQLDQASNYNHRADATRDDKVDIDDLNWLINRILAQ